MPFYEEIDSVNNTYLYSINYLGANYSSISKRELHYFSSFPFDGNLFYFKIIFVTIEYAFLILEILLIYLKKKNVFAVVFLGYFYMYVLCILYVYVIV